MSQASRWMVVAILAVQACKGSDSSPAPLLTRDELLDPQTCSSCHQDHYAEWAGSMHAYASTDPVFLAMNKRGQRETNGQLGTFCVNCHAPMAVREGLTTDGLNLDQVPQKFKGVTCFFCHTVESVNGAHNAPITLSTDLVLRGALTDPFPTGRTHLAGYSPLVDREQAQAASTCGSCHDIVTGHGAQIERTFTEWQASAFSTETGTTCGQCHMPQATSDTVAANVPGAPLRRPHSHLFPAIDKALTTFPDTDRQTQAVQALLDTTLQTALCVEPFAGGSIVSAIIDNVAGGHGFPSGSSQDRRVWTEVIAYQGTNVVYQSGVVPAGQAVTASTDPDLWLMRDCMFDENKSQVDMFWNAASFEGNALPALTTFDISSPNFFQTHKQKFFPAAGTTPITPTPDRITMRVLVRPMGLEVIDDLISSGDLDASVRAQIGTLVVGNTLEWTQATANATYVDRTGTGGTVFCKTDTNLNVAADRFPALTRADCRP
ncbi:MAG TPA: multiheme c-type cytochrome [Myxococcales bacterium]|nr:multiheme c-type cytochrome [Myxococcales bacterium]